MKQYILVVSGIIICIFFGIMLSNEIDNHISSSLQPWPNIDSDYLEERDDWLSDTADDIKVMPTLAFEDYELQDFAIGGIADTLLTISSAPTSFIFCAPDGREGVISFSGDEITYSGDLPVAESAKLFFEAYGNLCRSK
jgi:hypothetical protein